MNGKGGIFFIKTMITLVVCLSADAQAWLRQPPGSAEAVRSVWWAGLAVKLKIRKAAK